MKIQYMIVSQSSSIDQNNNLISIFEIIEDLAITKDDPRAIINLPVVCTMCISKDDTDASVELDFNITIKLIKTSDESILFEQNYPIHFDVAHKRFRFRLNTTIPVNDTNIYKFVAYKSDDENIRAEYPISIIVNSTH